MKPKTFSPGKFGNDIEDAPAGGTAYVAVNTDFVARGYKQAKGTFEPYRAGRDAARKAPPDGPIVENPELFIVGLVESNCDAQEGHAHSVKERALAEIVLGLEDLNEGAIQAALENKLRAAQHAAEEQALPAVKQLNDARGNLTQFEFEEEQSPLSTDSYDRWCPPFKPFLLLFLVLGPDALFNAFTYASAMPQGLIQALATAFCASAAMALCGVLVGTGLRFLNIRKERARRLLWRCIVVIAAVAALLIALSLAQYRALLEAAASDGGDATAYSIFTVAPGIVGLPVLVGCIIVFGFSVIEFRGGRGSPWARYGEHAVYDRVFRDAQDAVDLLKEDFALNTEQIYADGINFLHEAHDSERERLKSAKAHCANAKLKITDLKNSHLKFLRAAEPDIALVRAGIISVRPELEPEDFAPVTLPGTEGFPDPAELDAAIAQAESGFARRTAQLASLEKSVGQLAGRAREDFSRFLVKATRRDDTRRSPIRTVQIQTTGGRR